MTFDAAGGRLKLTSLKTIQLALQSRASLDIPPRIRRVIGVAGVAGLGMVVMGSLVSGGGQRVEVDKLLHFCGYSALAALFVLSLRPLLFLPSLVALVGMGVVLEFVQQVVGRSFDLRDALANSVGVAVGAALGLLARGVYAYVRKELALTETRRRLVSFGAGERIFHEGEATRRFFMIKRGMVEITRRADGKDLPITVSGPGDVIGAMSVVLGEPQQVSAVALTPVSLFAMDLRELMEAAGGRQQPVAAVLLTFAEKLRELGKRIPLAEPEPGPRSGS